MSVTVKRLESGAVHVRGRGPCNWTQPPTWPASEKQIREHAFPEASEEFLREATEASRKAAGVEVDG